MATSLRITFLGTGTSTGVPMIGCHCAVCTSADRKDKRLRSSILLETAATTVVIDTTPDFRYQMLRIGNERLNAVLFTHPHKDHIAGLDDVRAYNFFMQQPMAVYANSLTEETLKREFAYVFSDQRYPGIPEINLTTIDETPFSIGDIPFVPIQVWHYKMPVYGYRIGNFNILADAHMAHLHAFGVTAGTDAHERDAIAMLGVHIRLNFKNEAGKFQLGRYHFSRRLFVDQLGFAR